MFIIGLVTVFWLAFLALSVHRIADLLEKLIGEKDETD